MLGGCGLSRRCVAGATGARNVYLRHFRRLARGIDKTSRRSRGMARTIPTNDADKFLNVVSADGVLGSAILRELGCSVLVASLGAVIKLMLNQGTPVSVRHLDSDSGIPVGLFLLQRMIFPRCVDLHYSGAASAGDG